MITAGMKETPNAGCPDGSVGDRPNAIREARAEDVPRILGVINDTNKAFYEAIVPVDQYREPFLALEDVEAESQRITFSVYEQDDRIVGVIALEGRADGIGIIRRLYVLPDRQRGGIGKALLVHAEGRAKRKGLREIIVWTDPKATWAVSFYKRYGYREIEPRSVFSDPYVNARVEQHPETLVVLRKSL